MDSFVEMRMDCNERSDQLLVLTHYLAIIKQNVPSPKKLDTLPSGENFSPVHSISRLSACSLKEEKGPLSKDLPNDNNYTITRSYFLSNGHLRS